MRAELDAKDIELAEQARTITEHVTVIADQETLISKFRDLVIDLQNRVTNAEDSQTMTEAAVKDTTGRFNEVMDINRQLRAATLQSTTREIDAALSKMEAKELSQQIAIWNETESREFTKSEPLLAYFTAKRIIEKSFLLVTLLMAAVKHMSNGGRLEEVAAMLAAYQSAGHLADIHDNSSRLVFVIEGSSLAQYATFGPANSELMTIEIIIDHGLEGLKTDAINFDQLAMSLRRCTNTSEAVLANHQQALDSRPDLELLSRAGTFKNKLRQMSNLCTTTLYALQKVPSCVQEECNDILERIRGQEDVTKSALAAADKFKRTVVALRKDNMWPQFCEEFSQEWMNRQIEYATDALDDLIQFARRVVAQVLECANLSESSPSENVAIECSKGLIKVWNSGQQMRFGEARMVALRSALASWTDFASILLNNVEIDCGPTPWAQKAKEIDAARKKDDEIAQQLQNLTAEHRATILKIHEREQVIATKELEIEHLAAKNRDAAAKTEDLDALQTELAQRHAKIMELQNENRTQVMEIEALKERRARSDQSDDDEVEPANNTTARVEPVGHGPAPQVVPAGMKLLLDALQHENHWLRQREYKDQFDQNLQNIFEDMNFQAFREHRARYAAQMDAILESSFVDDCDADSLYAPPSPRSPASPTHTMHDAMTPLDLRAVQLGWESRSDSLKEAFEAREELMLETILEEEEFSYIHV
jgi:dynactin 1